MFIRSVSQVHDLWNLEKIHVYKMFIIKIAELHRI